MFSTIQSSVRIEFFMFSFSFVSLFVHLNRFDLRCRALRFAGIAAGVLPSCKTIFAHRCCVHNVDIAGELLLALHIRLRIGEHDIGIC